MPAYVPGNIYSNIASAETIMI